MMKLNNWKAKLLTGVFGLVLIILLAAAVTWPMEVVKLVASVLLSVVCYLVILAFYEEAKTRFYIREQRKVSNH